MQRCLAAGDPAAALVCAGIVLEAFRQRKAEPVARAPAVVPAGERVYAIGDVHGCLDLLAALAGAIREDDARRPRAATTIILLGDLIDRGPASAGVIDFAIAWRANAGAARVRAILGNHEEMFLAALTDRAAFRQFLRIGGYETIVSYGVERAAFDIAGIDAAMAMARAAVPARHLAFLAECEERIAIGDYLFVHAGIAPRVPLDAQRGEDLRWIREPFLDSPDDHGCVVVHGHTIAPDPAVRANRIGIDTGAFATGRLTALCLEGAERRLLEASDAGGAIAVRERAA